MICFKEFFEEQNLNEGSTSTLKSLGSKINKVYRKYFPKSKVGTFFDIKDNSCRLHCLCCLDPNNITQNGKKYDNDLLDLSIIISSPEISNESQRYDTKTTIFLYDNFMDMIRLKKARPDRRARGVFAENENRRMHLAESRTDFKGNEDEILGLLNTVFKQTQMCIKKNLEDGNIHPMFTEAIEKYANLKALSKRLAQQKAEREKRELILHVQSALINAVQGLKRSNKNNVIFQSLFSRPAIRNNELDLNFKTKDNGFDAEIRYMGKWVPDSYNDDLGDGEEGDDDFYVPDDQTIKTVNRIVDDINKEFKNIKLTSSYGEKCWWYFTCTIK